jgi:hypothetical protein
MFKSSLVSAAALALVIGAAPVLADQSAPPAQKPSEHAQQAMPVRGELISVNADTKSLTVKKADNAEVTFQYDDTTDVSGEKDSAAGLATMTNRQVTVHYTEDAASKVKLATRIIVHPDK